MIHEIQHAGYIFEAELDYDSGEPIAAIISISGVDASLADMGKLLAKKGDDWSDDIVTKLLEMRDE